MMEIIEMSALVEKWANINSHSENQAGLEQLLKEVQQAFQKVKPDEEKILTLSKSKALFLKKRKNAPIQIFFGGHLDTVFPREHPFQKVTYRDERTLQGPGVTDMKGGIVVMLSAIEMFEKTEKASQIGWEIFLNTDEELGSPYSSQFIKECSKRCDIALLFEPPLPDGSLASHRKGSSNYLVTSKGRKAHAGRDPKEGKNAIYPLAHFVSKLEAMHQPEQGTLVNVGLFRGGVAQNIIPDHAQCYLNVRADTAETMSRIEEKILELVNQFHLNLVKQSQRPPKPFDSHTDNLFHALKECGAKLGIAVKWKETGGVCDGNILGAAGIPTIDTLGVRGGNIHTENEYFYLESLSEKARLVSSFLNEIAQGKIGLKDVAAHRR